MMYNIKVPFGTRRQYVNMDKESLELTNGVNHAVIDDHFACGEI
mgnify:CR=1 FL=1